METITQEIFKASNGKLFFTKDECVSYENKLTITKNANEIMQYLTEEGWRHANGTGGIVYDKTTQHYRCEIKFVGFELETIYLSCYRLNYSINNREQHIRLRTCDIETFKLFHKNMLEHENSIY